MNITVYSYTDKTVKKQLNTSFDVALYIVDLLESFGGITPEDGKQIPDHGNFIFPNADEDDEAYGEAYRAAGEELIAYYSELEVHDALEKLIELAGSTRLYYIDRTPYTVRIWSNKSVPPCRADGFAWDDSEELWQWLSEWDGVKCDEAQLADWQSLPDDDIKELLEAAKDGGFIADFEIEEDLEEE